MPSAYGNTMERFPQKLTTSTTVADVAPAADHDPATMGRARLELNAMPYGDYLQTQEWRARAQAVRHLAGDRCLVCREHGHGEVHPARTFGEGMSGGKTLSGLRPTTLANRSYVHR